MPATHQPAKSRGIDTVHVIFKTHLDIGFTDFAGNVTKQYFQKFIPAALDTAERLAADGGPAQFIWTVGSWLVYEYLEQATLKQRRRMERAIAADQISWLGLPFTMHTELLDAHLFRFALSLAKDLDQRYGKKTIAAKMTDVPGHTIGMVPLMAEAGMKFLHIGVNAASAVPKTPPLFDWTLNNAALRVMVHGTYGGVTVLPGFKHALYFAHTNDNHGPQPIADIQALFAKLQTQFPGAKVQASNLNRYAAELMQYKKVPQYTKEIGDSWIRGVGTDPKKVAQFRALEFLRRSWLQDNPRIARDKRIHAFSRKLLLVAEHTWGLDEKTHLNDFKLYDRKAFARLRKTPAARKMERSWDEQRGYIRAAVAALGRVDLRRQAESTLAGVEPALPYWHDAVEHDPREPITCGPVTIRLDLATGALIEYTDRAHPAGVRRWADLRHPLGELQYTLYSQADYDRYYRQYARDTHLHGSWILPDITKPGMPRTIRHQEWTAQLHGLWVARLPGAVESLNVIVELHFPAICHRQFGAPGRAYLQYELHADRSAVSFELTWHEKPACRLPEALWLRFSPRLGTDRRWVFLKMGTGIDPLQVTPHGGRQLHAVDWGVQARDRDSGLFLMTSAPLVAPGTEDLIDFSTRQPDLRQGVRVNLYNNTWGTNFPMWYDEDAFFKFGLFPLKSVPPGR